MAKRISETESSVIVYDDSKLSHVASAMFTAEHWGAAAQNATQADAQVGGRGAVLYVNHEGADWVIRHYYRGGLVGKLLTDQYFWNGRQNTRGFREWQLLTVMQASQLPAPVPVAARYVRHGLWYTADLITANLGKVDSFAAVFAHADRTVWEAAGGCIARFHKEGFCHADLNASNIQIQADGAVYILDWDRGRRLSAQNWSAQNWSTANWSVGNWQQDNLKRLKRSLNKACLRLDQAFDQDKWHALLQSYDASLAAAT